MQNQHRINHQTSYFSNTVLYIVESVGYIADNVKRLGFCGVYAQSFFHAIEPNQCSTKVFRSDGKLLT